MGGKGNSSDVSIDGREEEGAEGGESEVVRREEKGGRHDWCGKGRGRGVGDGI